MNRILFSVKKILSLLPAVHSRFESNVRSPLIRLRSMGWGEMVKRVGGLTADAREKAGARGRGGKLQTIAALYKDHKFMSWTNPSRNFHDSTRRVNFPIFIIYRRFAWVRMSERARASTERRLDEINFIDIISDLITQLSKLLMLFKRINFAFSRWAQKMPCYSIFTTTSFSCWENSRLVWVGRRTRRKEETTTRKS